jgi:DNA (cytosine-5)-methyltransferase 1
VENSAGANGEDTASDAGPQPTFIDLFAGIGGIRLGLEQAGLGCVFSSEIDAAAQRTYAANFGAEPAGDVRLVDAAAVPNHALLAAGFPCFAKGTLVLAREGYKPIEEIVVGAEVLTHLGRWRRVTTVMSRRGAPLRRIRAQGVVVTTTDEHPFWARKLTMRRNKRSFGDPQWIEASKLTRGHFLAQVLPDVKPDKKTVEFWWLTGRYLADGWRVRRKSRPDGSGRVVICCARAEADELRGRIAAAGFHAAPATERTVVKFHIVANSLYQFLEPFGHLAHGKTLPGFALSLSRAKSAALLDGYMSGDGSVYELREKAGGKLPGGARATTVSKRLAFGMALLAQRIGVVASVLYTPRPKTCVIEGRLVRQRPTWSITVPQHNRSGFVEGQYGWKLGSRSARCGRGTVYNLSVDEDESYMADGAVTHNCQSFSISGRQGGFADARGTLFFEILRIAAAKATPVLLLENVKHLVHHDGGRTLTTILKSLEECGYAASWRILNAKDFGVAQNRERIMIVADHGGRMFDFSALRTSPPVALRDMLDAEGGFQWLRPDEYTLLENPAAARSGLVFAGYRNKRIRVAGVRPGTQHLSRVHKQPNRIYRSDGLHPTLSAGESSGRYFILHGGRVRRLTLDECFRLMGFPERFARPGPASALYRQVGNSVCVPMFAEFGREVARQLLAKPVGL